MRRTSDRASACTQAPRMFYRLVICFLSSCTLFMVSFKLMLFLFFFHFYYPYIPSVMNLVQFLSKFFFSVFSFSISRDTCISICLGHYQTFSTNRKKSRSAPYVAFDRYCEAAVTSDFRTTFFFPLFLGCQRMRVT